MTKSKKYIPLIRGSFSVPGDTSVYLIEVKSPYGYETVQEAMDADVVWVFRNVGGNMLLIAEGGSPELMRDYKTNVIPWNNWYQYRIGVLRSEDSVEEPCAVPWDELFGVAGLANGYECPIEVSDVSVFAYMTQEEEEEE